MRGRVALLPPKVAKRVKPEDQLLSTELRVLSREAGLKRFTAPKVKISSLVIDLLTPWV